VSVRAIEHVQLAMPPGGEDQARKFYRDLLGIPEVQKPPRLAARGGCWFEQGDLKIHLGIDREFRPSKKPIRVCSLIGLGNWFRECLGRDIRSPKTRRCKDSAELTWTIHSATESN
jgi:catechol 2,3-dioxygenase-like lactoylglutathione lyase family enzyme